MKQVYSIWSSYTRSITRTSCNGADCNQFCFVICPQLDLKTSIKRSIPFLMSQSVNLFDK